MPRCRQPVPAAQPGGLPKGSQRSPGACGGGDLWVGRSLESPPRQGWQSQIPRSCRRKHSAWVPPHWILASRDCLAPPPGCFHSRPVSGGRSPPLPSNDPPATFWQPCGLRRRSLCQRTPGCELGASWRVIWRGRRRIARVPALTALQSPGTIQPAMRICRQAGKMNRGVQWLALWDCAMESVFGTTLSLRPQSRRATSPHGVAQRWGFLGPLAFVFLP